MGSEPRPEGLSRREFVGAWGAGTLLGLGPTLVPPEARAAPPQAGPGLSGDQALRQLLAGNKRYVAGRATRPNQTARRRGALARGQQPSAVVLGCADSRVPPELIFDQGLGDLFVVRIAGNVVDDLGLASLEYAVAVLGVPLLMVLGHEKCGAVEAAVTGANVPGHLGRLVKAIRPAVETVRGQPGDPLDAAVRANVAAVVARLKAAKPILAERVTTGRLKVVGARYDLDTGGVDVIA